MVAERVAKRISVSDHARLELVRKRSSAVAPQEESRALRQAYADAVREVLTASFGPEVALGVVDEYVACLEAAVAEAAGRQDEDEIIRMTRPRK